MTLTPIRLGYTGSQHGMTRLQAAVVAHSVFCLQGKVAAAHHGSCIEGDEEFALFVHELLPGVAHVAHPGYPPKRPDDFSRRAWVEQRWPDEVTVLEPRPFLDRNTDIVVASTQMLCAPRERREQTYSGTWSTIRRARKFGRPHRIVYPDGSVEDLLGYRD
jgi:hypothetical protein